MKVSLPFSMVRKNLGNKGRPVNNIEQTQRLVEIGLQLRQTRQHHSLSLDMVAAYTMIRSHLLQAIEEGQIENLPEPVYTQGLIRRYGNALGLNGEELANFFLPEPIPSIVSSSWILPLPQLRPTHLYLTYILLILGTMHGLVYLIKSSPEIVGLPEQNIAQTTPTANSPQSMNVSNTSENSSTGQLVLQASQTSSPTNQAAVNKTVEVGIIVKDESWVLIEVDGKTEFQGILQGGTKRTWKAQEELVVVAGNAGGVIVTLNNGESRRLGEPGMVEEAVFKANNSPSETVNSNS